jgi:hypothetical protein
LLGRVGGYDSRVPSFRALGVVLISALLVVPAAHASFPSSIETTVAPGGTSSVGSPPLPPSMRSATVDVMPAESEDEDLFRNMQVVLSLQPTPGKRLLTCISLYAAAQSLGDDEYMVQFPEELQPLAVLLLSACLQMAAEVNRAAQGSAQRAAASAATCHRAATQVGATFSRVGKKYKATIDGTRTKLRKRGRLTVTCKRKGKGLTLTARPTAKGTSLRSVVGPRLRLGVYNPLESTGSGRLRLTFRR